MKPASFLATTPNRKFLYVISEGRMGKDDSIVSAFQIDSETGKLAFLNQQPSGGSTGPCYVSPMDPKGRGCFGGELWQWQRVGFSHWAGTGALGPMSGICPGSRIERQSFAASGGAARPLRGDGSRMTGFVFVCDLGLDKVMIFKFDRDRGIACRKRPHCGLGASGRRVPRHIAFHPNRRYAYVINEMAATVTAFAYDPLRGGVLTRN